MSHGDDLNGRVGDTVDYGIRKPPKKKFSRTLQMPRPALGSVTDFTDRLVKLGDESVCGRRIALEVPEKGGSSFRSGVGVKLNVWTSHGIVRRSDDVPRTTERSSLFPYRDRRCGARFPYSTPTPLPRPPVRLSFPTDDRPAPRALRQEDVALLVKLFCDWGSCNGFYISRSHQHKFERGYRFESDKTNWPNDPAERVSESGSVDSVSRAAGYCVLTGDSHPRQLRQAMLFAPSTHRVDHWAKTNSQVC